MIVRQNIEGNLYKKLIKYAKDNNNYIALTYRPTQTSDSKYLKRIFLITQYDKDYIINNFSLKLIGNIFESIKTNEFIFDKEFIAKYEKHMIILTNKNNYNLFLKNYKTNEAFRKSWIKKYLDFNININFANMKYEEFICFVRNDIRLDFVANIIGNVYYEYIIKKQLYDWNKYVVKKVEHRNNKNTIDKIKYYFEFSSDIYNEIVNKNSLLDLCYPFSIEDLEIYNDSNCWLTSVAHEEIIDILFNSAEEFEFLKSIGIKFEND